VLNQFEQMVECTQLLQLLPFSDDPAIISVLPVREPSQLAHPKGGLRLRTPAPRVRVLVKVGSQDSFVRDVAVRLHTWRV